MSLLSSIGRKITDFVGGTNSQAGDRTLAAANQNLQNARLGVLANPATRQQFIAGNQASSFNPVTAGAGAAYGFVKAIPAGVVNTVQVPYSVGRVGVANITGNQQAAARARLAVGSDTQNNLFSPDVAFLRSTAAAGLNPVSNIYATREANRAKDILTRAYEVNPQTGRPMQIFPKGQADLESSRIKQQFIQDQLRRAGLNQNDSLARTSLKIGAQGGQLLANSVMQADMGNNFVDGALGRSAPKPTVKLASNKLIAAAEPYVRPAATNAGLMAGTNLLGTAQQDNPTTMDYVKSGAQGITQGALLSVGSELAGQAVHGAAGLAKQGLDTPEIAQLKAQKQASIDAMDTASPKMMKAHVANVNSLDAQIKALQERGSAEVGGPLIPIPKVMLKDGLTKSDLTIGEALGMSRKDILAAKNANGLEDAFKTRTASMTPQDLADLSPKDQMALANYGKPTLAPKETNTARNPYKSQVTEVQPGDYGHAIANSQLVSRPIDLARSQWERSMKRLTPEERDNFWRAAEDPKNSNHSPEMQTAIDRWRQVDNKVHGESQALGGNTNYLTDHALHPWQLPEEFTQHIINGNSPGDFKGLNNISRKYRTIAEGEANGLKLGNDPIGEGTRYLQANSAILRKAALKQGLAEADALNTSKPHTLDLGNGHTVQLSREGFKAAKGVQFHKPSDNPLVKGIRTGQSAIKSTVLSAGQFHPINISLLRAAPTLALPKLEALAHGDLTAGSHPVRAVEGAYRTFRAAFGSGYADRVIGKAIQDGTVDKAALIGMPYGSNAYANEGSALKGGVGHKMVFERQMPMMHDQVARSIISDLEKRGIPLDSAEARQAGAAGNKTMGFINQEVMHIDPRVNQGLSDALLAKQFTHSKFSQLNATTQGGIGGSYARANVAANTAASAALIIGLGYAFQQKSDNVKDMLLRALVDPAVPTPLKDDKGNTVKLRLPGTDTSDVAKLLGMKLVRGADGHLAVNWDIKNLPSTVADFARARLGPIASAGVKIATNTTFAGKPLYDPNAPAGKKTIQAGTSIITGDLPIGLQGLPQTDLVKKHLPGSAQEVLNAQKPGTNPLLKSFGSSFGLTPTTDATTGKALDTNRYFTALDEAKAGLNRQEKDAIDLYTGSKKNPVTGAYDVQPSVQDTSTKAKVLLQSPKVVDKLVEMNQKLAGLGQSVDPLWQQPTDKITKYLQYQAMPPGGADRSHWMTQNKDWYTPLADSRTAFFDKLPAGDPNKPAAPIEFPAASPDVAAKQKTFFALPDSQARAKYLTENPDVQTQLDKQVEYNNQMREAQGYSALDTFPKANSQVQQVIDAYNSLPKNDGPKGGNKTRSLWIQNHPNEYAAMTQYFTQASLYGLEQSSAQAQFKDTGYDQKGLKDLYNLGQHDVQKLTDANGNTFYALGSGSSSSGGSGSSGGYSKGSSKYGSGSSRYNQAVYDSKNPYKYSIDLSTGGGAQAKPKVSVKTASTRGKVASRGGSAKPKVTIKRSLA